MEAAGGDVVRSVSLVVVIWFGYWWCGGGISVRFLAMDFLRIISVFVFEIRVCS